MIEHYYLNFQLFINLRDKLWTIYSVSRLSIVSSVAGNNLPQSSWWVADLYKRKIHVYTTFTH